MMQFRVGQLFVERVVHVPDSSGKVKVKVKVVV